MADTTFIPGVGRLAADRYSFQAHVDGYEFNHNADAITVIPGIGFDGYTHTNVYSSLSAISDELATLELSGKGFILVGDGYDTYLNSIATPDTPYDSTVPAFNTYLNDVLNNTANPLHFRIRDGGIIVIKAGTYKFTGSVNVPPGTILMGEGYGTKIVNQGGGTAPLFIIKADTTRIPDAGVDAVEKFIFCRETMLINLTIADNFLVPKFLGDLSYKTPINAVSGSPVVNPLVSLEEGASLSCENVRFVGKTTYSLGVLIAVSSFAISTDSTIPSSTGTRLKIFNSSIDGFSIPVRFTAAGLQNDNCNITNTLIRGYGYYTQDFVSPANNTLLKFNACNITVSNNYCFGYDNTLACLAYITPAGSPPIRQSKARILVSNNNVAVDKTNNTANNTFQFVRFSGVLNNSLDLINYGNNFDGRGFTVAIDGYATQLQQTSTAFSINTTVPVNISTTGNPLTVTSNNAIAITATSSADIDIQSSSETHIIAPLVTINNNGSPGALSVTQMSLQLPIALVTSNYVVGDGEYVLLVNTTGGAINVSVPSAATVGRTLIIKDSGNAAVNNITITRQAGGNNIEGLNANYVMNTNFQVVRLIARSNDWWMI